MKTLFKEQLKTNKPITEKILSELKIKNYYSGKNIKVGDIVLHAMLNKGIISEGVLGAELITLNENEFYLYSVDERLNDGKGIPVVNLNMSNDYIVKIQEEIKETKGQTSSLETYISEKLSYDDAIKRISELEKRLEKIGPLTEKGLPYDKNDESTWDRDKQ